jgi:plasmid maintenance system antidote protein VapI
MEQPVYPLDKVRRWYQENKFSASQLAERLGFHRGTVTRVLNRKRGTTEETARRYYEEAAKLVEEQ